jgi:hypothetical protein
VTFAEICAQVAEEVNGRPLAFSSVALTGTNALTNPFQRRVVRAVQTVYMNVLNASRFWKFLNRRGKILVIHAGKREYSLASIQAIEWDSLYLTKEGMQARWPVNQESYDTWKSRERSVYTSTGIPLCLIKNNQPDSWLVWPVPNEDYQLNGNVYYKPVPLAGADDEPIWDEIYHEMLVWMAVSHLEQRVKTQDEIVSKLNASNAVAQASALYNAFQSYYLPETIGAETLA